MSRHLGWPERHGLRPDDLRHLADSLDRLQADEPLLGMQWDVDVVAPKQAWARFDARGDQ